MGFSKWKDTGDLDSISVSTEIEYKSLMKCVQERMVCIYCIIYPAVVVDEDTDLDKS